MTVHEATFIVLVIVNPSVVIGTLMVALKVGRGPVGEGVRLDARIVAPAMELMAPSDAIAAAAYFMAVPMGEAATNSSVATAARAAGERCRSVIRVTADRFNQAQRRRRDAMSFMVMSFGSVYVVQLLKCSWTRVGGIVLSCSRSRFPPRPCLPRRPRVKS